MRGRQPIPAPGPHLFVSLYSLSGRVFLLLGHLSGVLSPVVCWSLALSQLLVQSWTTALH